MKTDVKSDVTAEVEEVAEDTVEEVLEELKQGLPGGADADDGALIDIKGPGSAGADADDSAPIEDVLEMVTKREYRLELFEEGDQKVFARQRGLKREGWKAPAIHGFRRHTASGLVADSFLILVASRDLEVPAGEAG